MAAGPCSVCGAPATLLCDFVIGVASSAHGAERFTCDRPLCRRCAVRRAVVHVDYADRRGRRRWAWLTIDHCPDHPPRDARPPVMTAAQAAAVRRGLDPAPFAPRVQAPLPFGGRPGLDAPGRIG